MLFQFGTILEMIKESSLSIIRVNVHNKNTSASDYFDGE